jgi:hypothetical protein
MEVPLGSAGVRMIEGILAPDPQTKDRPTLSRTGQSHALAGEGRR